MNIFAFIEIGIYERVFRFHIQDLLDLHVNVKSYNCLCSLTYS